MLQCPEPSQQEAFEPVSPFCMHLVLSPQHCSKEQIMVLVERQQQRESQSHTEELKSNINEIITVYIKVLQGYVFKWLDIVWSKDIYPFQGTPQRERDVLGLGAGNLPPIVCTSSQDSWCWNDAGVCSTSCTFSCRIVCTL